MSDQMTAMVQGGGNNPTLYKTQVPKPKPGSHQLLVKVSHVAQNPTDILGLDSNRFGDGAILGCDFVGVVEEVGKDVTRRRQGDVIAGLVRGGEIKGVGAYSEYTLADERICFVVPDSISRAEAATVPLAAATAWLALFSKDCLDVSRTDGTKPTVLIWGGSSSVGLYAIQLARLQGLTVMTTCSPKNFVLVRNCGAEYVFDYADADVIDQITEIEPNLRHIFDTIGNKTSSGIASQAASRGGGALCTVRPGKMYTENVPAGIKVTDVLVWTAFLKEHRYGDRIWPASQEDHELVAELFESLPAWLDSRKVRPNNPKVMKGLDSVPDGFQEYRDGKVSAYKIVYEL